MQVHNHPSLLPPKMAALPSDFGTTSESMAVAIGGSNESAALRAELHRANLMVEDERARCEKLAQQPSRGQRAPIAGKANQQGWWHAGLD